MLPGFRGLRALLQRLTSYDVTCNKPRMQRKVTPKSMVLDLLRVAPAPGVIPVKSLVDVGAMFAFEGNAVRVAITRLVRDGLVESDERGSYRLAPRAAPLSRIVEDWCLGDDRTRPWRGRWLAVWHPRGGARAVRQRSRRALELLGFRDALDGTWVRPDNLVLDRAAIAARATELGLVDGAHVFVASDFASELAEQWTRSLWPVRALQRTYRSVLADLERSAARLDDMSAELAVVEAFMLGGTAIRTLALDPLLPDEINPGDARRRLHDAMLRYDAQGRTIWRSLIVDAKRAPTHLSVVTHA